MQNQTTELPRAESSTTVSIPQGPRENLILLRRRTESEKKNRGQTMVKEKKSGGNDCGGAFKISRGKNSNQGKETQLRHWGENAAMPALGRKAVDGERYGRIPEG